MLCASSLSVRIYVHTCIQPQKARAASGFSLFVKENYGSVKSGDSTAKKLTHGEVMKSLSRMYAEAKETGDVPSSKDTADSVTRNLFSVMR